MPHDLVGGPDGSVFVGDAGSEEVFKFSAESEFFFMFTFPSLNLIK